MSRTRWLMVRDDRVAALYRLYIMGVPALFLPAACPFACLRACLCACLCACVYMRTQVYSLKSR